MADSDFDSGSDDENVKSIELKFKTIQETVSLQAKENSTIGKLKTALSTRINQPVEKICLIFSGKILKDHDTLTQHHIGDGMVIHMVIRNQQTTPRETNSPATAATSAPTTTAPTTATAAGPSPFGGLGGGGIFNNPELIRGIMNSPLMESLLGNPEIMRSMFTENPQLQQIIQNNPELGHIMNDPGTMRHMMEIVRNPTMLNELMRNNDQAIRNLQGIPGGEAALQRLYEQVQEPLMNSVLGGQPGTGAPTNPTAATDGSAQSDSARAASRSQHAGVENAQPLPNPWSNIVNQQNTAGTNGDATAQGSTPNIFGMMNTPGMQSLFRQISSNPAAMQQMLSQENMSHFSQMMGNNPALFQQMMQSIPGFDNPAIAEQLRNNMPQITSMMTNPQMLQAMSNPRVLNAVQQIQQAFQVIRQEAPQLLASFPGADMLQNLGGMAGLFGGVANAASQQQNQQAPAGQNASSESQPQNAATPGGLPTGLAELLGSLMNLSTTTATSNQPPAERFRTQLEQLTAMGFNDQQANIQALLASFGDVNGAIERLLSSGGGGNTGEQ